MSRRSSEHACPGIEEDDLNVEQDEEHGDQIILDGEGSPCVREGNDAGLVRLQLLLVAAFWPEDRGKRHGNDGKTGCDGKQYQKREVVNCHGFESLLRSQLRSALWPRRSVQR